MSFIYEDDSLVKLLVQAGTNHINKFAQTNPIPAVNWKNNYELAKTLLIGLQRKIDPKSAPPISSHIGVAAGSPETDLKATTKDLRTLGDFIRWAAEKKFTWDGKRFAWQMGEAAIPPEAWVFTTFKRDRNNRDLETREPIKVEARALKPELISFLSYFRDTQAKDNDVLRVYLNKIIEEVNVFLQLKGEPAIKAKPSTEEESKPDLNPEAKVDGLPSDVLNEKDPYAGIGAAPTFLGVDESNILKVKHLTNMGLFTNWLSKKKIVIGNKKVGVLDVGGDPCTALNILFKRAQQLAIKAPGQEDDTPNYVKMVALYSKQLQVFGKSFNKDGVPCIVSSSGTNTGGISTVEEEAAAWKGKPGAEDGSGGSSTQVTMQNLEDVINSLPLDIQNIDFSRIHQFFNTYKPLLANSNSSKQTEVATAMNLARTAMKYATQITIGNKQSFDMFVDPSRVIKWIAPPEVEKKYISLLTNLRSVIENTKTVIDAFYGQYVRAANKTDKVIFDSEQKAQIEAQVLGNNSIFNNNWRRIRDLESRINEVITYK